MTISHDILYFYEKWKKEKGEIGGRCLHFFTLLILVKLFKSIGVGIIYIGQWGGGGGGEGLVLVEVEVFSGVGGGGEFFSGKLIFLCGR